MRLQLLILLLIALQLTSGRLTKSARDKRRAEKLRQQRLQYRKDTPHWYDRPWRKFMNFLHCQSGMPYEFQGTLNKALQNNLDVDAPNGGTNNLQLREIAAYMQRIDTMFERDVREHLLQDNLLLILGPTPATGSMQQVAHSTLNPVLYRRQKYSVVFQVGELYPTFFPYLSVYLVKGRNHRGPSLGKMLHLKTFFVDEQSLEVKAKAPGAEKQSGTPHDYVSKLYRTTDHSYVFEFMVPNSISPQDDYCFYFDMTKFDPADIGRVDQGAAVPSQVDLRKWSKLKPKTWKRFFHMTGHYHVSQASSYFPIRDRPQVFSAAWFTDLFGGEDLLRLTGGSILSFEEFNIVFLGKSEWPKELFMETVKQRADSVREWFEEIIYDTQVNWRQNQMNVIRPARANSGFGMLEDRFKAQKRAVGLLYHPHGRETLKRLGEMLLTIADNYETTLVPFHRWLALWEAVKQFFANFWQNHIAGFRSARKRLVKWTGMLKRCFSVLPSTAEFEELKSSQQVGGRGYCSQDLLGSGRGYNLQEIETGIVSAVRDMMMYEIGIVMLYMGQRLMRPQSNADRLMDGFFGMSDYNTIRVVTVAAAIRVYGTKFSAMADDFVLGGDGQQVNSSSVWETPKPVARSVLPSGSLVTDIAPQGYFPQHSFWDSNAAVQDVAAELFAE